MQIFAPANTKMALIKIPKKPKLSSKPQTLNKTSDVDGEVPSDAGEGVIQVTPFIDRLSLVLPIIDTDDGYDIHSNIWSNLKDTEVFKSGKAGGRIPGRKEDCT